MEEEEVYGALAIYNLSRFEFLSVGGWGGCSLYIIYIIYVYYIHVCIHHNTYVDLSHDNVTRWDKLPDLYKSVLMTFN